MALCVGVSVIKVKVCSTCVCVSSSPACRQPTGLCSWWAVPERWLWCRALAGRTGPPGCPHHRRRCCTLSCVECSGWVLVCVCVCFGLCVYVCFGLCVYLCDACLATLSSDCPSVVSLYSSSSSLTVMYRLWRPARRPPGGPTWSHRRKQSCCFQSSSCFPFFLKHCPSCPGASACHNPLSCFHASTGIPQHGGEEEEKRRERGVECGEMEAPVSTPCQASCADLINLLEITGLPGLLS